VGGGAKPIGLDDVIVARSADAAVAEALAAPLFDALGLPRSKVSLTRNRYPEIELALVPAMGLKRELPLPYPGPRR